MSTYIYAIKEAMIIFPFIAILFVAPFIKSEMKKHGRVFGYDVLITYSFIFYLVCAFSLVVFPIPDFGSFNEMVSLAPQLKPFNFISDIIREQPTSITDNCIIVVLFNILLTAPFGIYLKNCFNMNTKEIVICTFALSLFFELTQLTGIYFILPKAYRLFDVDDLLLNTLGGFLGATVAPAFWFISLKKPTLQPTQLKTTYKLKPLYY